jgi:hypothetical protein
MKLNNNIKFLCFFTRSRLILLLLLVFSLAVLTSGYLQKSFAAVSATTFTVTNTNDSGAGSLRQVILDANANPGTDTIAFNIAPGGVQTITPTTILPTITDPVIIDGTTQPGFAGTPLIVINGINLTASNSTGLRISAGNSLVRGLIINNVQSGWGLRLDTAGGNTIQGNYIGVDETGAIRRGNDEGIGIFVSNDNLIGGTTPSQRNVIAGSRWENIWVGQSTLNNKIKGNFIGTNAQGTASIGNGNNGITNDGSNSVIGGTEPGAGNIISGNGQYGIYLGGRDVIVQGNYIGTDITGTQIVANSGSGIYVSGGGGAVIGGTTAAARNIISGNSSGISYSSVGNNPIGKIQGNYIGTDVTGMVALPNGWGIFVNEPVQIGGTEPGAGNLISGNSIIGIRIDDSRSIVQGNLIGTDATGLRRLENNAQVGIMIHDFENIIGGNQLGAGNVISGNTTGIQMGGLTSSSPSGNKIQGNFIGTDKSGNYAIPNTNSGIIISAGENNIIGGTNAGEENVIAYNIKKGIFVSGSGGSTIGNAIRRNSIFLNTEMGIDLGAQGVRINDSCDADTGANNLQNYPVLTSAVSNGTTTNVVGSLNSTASTTFALDFYVSPTYDATNYGEGKIYIGSTNVTTAANCTAEFNVSLPFPAAGAQFITATATDPNGNTSEFSQYLRAGGTSLKTIFDFDGDGKTDIGVFRPSDGSWWYTRSSANDFRVYAFGASSDIITPGDYTGDGKTDLGVFRPSTGEWFIQRSEDNSYFSFPFGAAGDIPAPADYDADGKTDAAVYRPSSGTWFILNSGGSGTSIVQFGTAEDKPVSADYDGDGRADIAIFRPSDGSWWYLRSSDSSFRVYRFGVGTDKPVPGDYTGDGKADIAVWRPETGEWYFQRSEDNSYFSVPFGANGDVPAPGDYDGDGRFDTAVFRPGTADWFVQRSTSGILITNFGTNGDRPIPNAFVP